MASDSAVRAGTCEGAPSILDRSAADEAPEVSVKASLLLHPEQGFRVLDGRGDLETVAHDAGSGKQPGDLARAVTGDLSRGNHRRQSDSSRAFSESSTSLGPPGRLRGRGTRRASVIVDRDTPFFVVIGDGRLSRSPGTTRHFLEHARTQALLERKFEPRNSALPNERRFSSSRGVEPSWSNTLD